MRKHQHYALSTFFQPYNSPSNFDPLRHIAYGASYDNIPHAETNSHHYLTETLETLLHSAIRCVSKKTPVLVYIIDGYSISQIKDIIGRTAGAIHHRLYKKQGLVNCLRETFAWYVLINPVAVEDAVEMGLFDILIDQLTYCNGSIKGKLTGRQYINNIDEGVWLEIEDGLSLPEAISKVKNV